MFILKIFLGMVGLVGVLMMPRCEWIEDVRKAPMKGWFDEVDACQEHGERSTECREERHPHASDARGTN